MTDKDKAISITEEFIKNNEIYRDFVVDTEGILDRESVWYVPFKEVNPDPNNLLVGTYNGLIVDKYTVEYFQPGSALKLDEWIYGFNIGLRGERYDLVIDKINKYSEAIEVLEKLGLTYVKIEIEGGTELKIPKSFNKKDIKRRLEKIPCVFKNQSFTFSIEQFKQIRNQKIFDYKLLKTENKNSKILGELVED